MCPFQKERPTARSRSQVGEPCGGGGGPQDVLGDSISLPVHPGQPQHRRPAPILHVTAGTGARPQRASATGTDASVLRERQGGVDEDRLGGASSGRGLGSAEPEPRRLPRSFLSGLELCTNLPLLLALEGGAGAPGGAPRSTRTPTRAEAGRHAAAQVRAQEDAQLPRPHQRPAAGWESGRRELFLAQAPTD